MGENAPKVSKGRSQTSSVFIALWSPPQRRNPCASGKTSVIEAPFCKPRKRSSRRNFRAFIRRAEEHRFQRIVFLRQHPNRGIQPAEQAEQLRLRIRHGGGVAFQQYLANLNRPAARTAVTAKPESAASPAWQCLPEAAAFRPFRLIPACLLRIPNARGSG